MTMACTVHNLKLVLNKFLAKTFFFKEKNLKDQKISTILSDFCPRCPPKHTYSPLFFFEQSLAVQPMQLRLCTNLYLGITGRYHHTHI